MKRFGDIAAADGAVETSPPSALASPTHKAAVAAGVSPSSPGNAPAPPQPHPAALTAIANAGLVKELEARGTGKPLSAGELDKIKSDMRGGTIPVSPSATPHLLPEPRRGKPDDLSLIRGVSAKMVEKLNRIGVWHFDQIARWTPTDISWLESRLDGFKGRAARDKWIEQAEKLASGWRPETKAGDRPKE
jgi:NADH-quinone oxidoreductase subunit E